MRLAAKPPRPNACLIAALTACALSLGACKSGGEPVVPECEAIQVAAKNSAVLVLGRSVQLVATAYRDVGGVALSAPDSMEVEVAWRSADASVIAISGNATATAVSTGSTTLTALACGKSDTVSVLVIPAGYRVTELQLPGARSAEVTGFGLNDDGYVVGRTSGEPATNLLWTDGAITDLGDCNPVAINIHERVLCQVPILTDRVGTGPIIWENGSATERDTVRGLVRALNDSGHVAGDIYLWRGPGQRTLIGGEIADVNNRDEIALHSGFTYPHPYLVRATQWIELDHFSRQARVHAINDSADVVGTSERMTWGGNNWVATLWRTAVDTRPQLLRPADPVGNDVAVAALDINNRRQIVGTGSQGVFLWRDGRLALLNQLLADSSWTISSVQRINNRGQILAHGTNSKSGRSTAVLIDPP